MTKSRTLALALLICLAICASAAQTPARKLAAFSPFFKTDSVSKSSGGSSVQGTAFSAAIAKGDKTASTGGTASATGTVASTPPGHRKLSAIRVVRGSADDSDGMGSTAYSRTRAVGTNPYATSTANVNRYTTPGGTQVVTSGSTGTAGASSGARKLHVFKDSRAYDSVSGNGVTGQVGSYAFGSGSKTAYASTTATATKYTRPSTAP